MTLEEAYAVVDRYDRSHIEQEAFERLQHEIERLRSGLWRIRKLTVLLPSDKPGTDAAREIAAEVLDAE